MLFLIKFVDRFWSFIVLENYPNIVDPRNEGMLRDMDYSLVWLFFFLQYLIVLRRKSQDFLPQPSNLLGTGSLLGVRK